MIAAKIALCAVVLGVSACASAEGPTGDVQPRVASFAPMVTRMMPAPPAAPAAPAVVEVAEVRVGQASWYGMKFQGRPTASGEPFDMNDLTAAHRTLPFGTEIRVINEDNGKSVVVRVNDRGPYVGNRVIDLSRKAAEAIGLRAKGVGRVVLQVLEKV